MVSVRRWLALVCGSIVIMILLGGITRLTESGLSIVDWKPILGTIPPLDADQWQHAFDLYKKSPQYRLVNFEMTLPEFKRIFFWEYFHRLVGRALGLIVVLPLICFTIRRSVQGRLAVRLWFGFFLGCLQGALGWFMVKSGLVDEPRVSHLRLAAHLILALAILAYYYWIFLELGPRAEKIESVQIHHSLRLGFCLLGALIALQITYGAFTAGLRAGWGYNTFPLMGGRFFPSDFLDLSPLVSNFIMNRSSVQWIHRSLGWMVLGGGIAWVWRFLKQAKENAPRLTLPAKWLGILILSQFVLGVLTLVLRVPIVVASLHQLGAILILLAWIRIHHRIEKWR